MSSSSCRVSVHPHGKRPFEECGGYGSDPDSAMPISSGTSTAFDPRNKRARSTSSTSTDDSSHPSSSSGYNTAQSSSLSDIFADGTSATTPDCPVATQDVHMSDLHLPLPPPQPHRVHVQAQEDPFRASLQRFAEFDRQIAALRTSLVNTRSSPMPALGPSVDGDPIPSNDHWHSHSSNFLPNDGSSLPLSTATDPASSTVAVAPGETPNSLSTFASSNESANIVPPSATTSGSLPSASFTPPYSNVPRYPPYPSYRPSTGGSSLPVPVGDAPSASSAPAFMRPLPNENTTRPAPRSSVSVDSSASPSTSHLRHPRRSLSPLVFPPDPSSSPPPSLVTDDISLRYRASLNREIQSRSQAHVSEQQRPQHRLEDRARVFRQHSTDRESVPSVFDVFNIGNSTMGRDRPAALRQGAPRFTPIAEAAVPRGPGAHDERSRGPTPMSTAANVNQVPSQDPQSRHRSSWASVPSSNSLMSESASERRHALALERFRARFRRSSFDADDESDSRWSGSSRERDSGGVASPVPPSPSVESAPGTGTSPQFPILEATRAPPTTNRAEPGTSGSLQRSFSELFAETQRVARQEGADAWLVDLDRPSERGEEHESESRQRERVLEWDRERERQREQSSQDVRGRVFVTGSGLASTREESTHLPMTSSSVPPRPSLGQLGPNMAHPNTSSTNPATNGNQSYSYSNLNLSSFQSGLFRDSLRRNAEVDQASFTASGPVIPPPVTTMDSHATSRLGFDDSGSDMDLDDFVRTRPPSPEWSRPHPYAGRTPPPDYSPPPRSFTLRPGFSILRGGMVNFDPPVRPQLANRNASMFTRPMPPTPSTSVRPTPYENNQTAPSDRSERDRFLPARLLESFYRSHEDGRRSASGQPYQPPNQNHALALGSGAVSRNDVLGGPRSASRIGNANVNRPAPEVVGENRRSSLGGTLRSRLARFANPQSSSSTADAASSRPRSPPRPIGARPQAAEQRRRGSLVFRGTSAFEAEPRSVSGPPHWAVNAGAPEPPAVARDVPWRTSSASRNVFVPPPPASGSARTEMPDLGGRAEDHRSRLRTLRQRLQLERGDSPRAFRPGMLRAAMGRRGNLGDYVPDDLFDDSYEALLSLSNMLGEVRSKATPDEVIASLPTGTFKEWKRDDSETRCPICLDDYEPSDVLTKLIECPHWLHKHCMEQWLRTANTCPVCREKVKASPKPAPARRRPYRDTSTSESSQGASSSFPGNAPSARSAHTNPSTNNGRSAAFVAMAFDRFMSESGGSEAWGQVPPPSRNARNVYVERLRAQQARESNQATHTHDGFVELPPSYELPHHLRVPLSGQPGMSSSRPTAGTTSFGGTDGSGMRSFGFVSLSRGQGSGSSTSSLSSISSAGMLVDEVGSNGRRSVVGTGGSPGSGPLFFYTPQMPRRESAFPFVPPSSSSVFSGPGGSAALPPPPPPPQQQQPSFDPRPPTVVISSSTESPRDWRDTRGYDAMFNVEASRSSSSSVPASQARPMSVANRIPIDEDNAFDDHMFGWNVYGRRLGSPYPNPFEEEPTRRTT